MSLFSRSIVKLGNICCGICTTVIPILFKTVALIAKFGNNNLNFSIDWQAGNTTLFSDDLLSDKFVVILVKFSRSVSEG